MVRKYAITEGELLSTRIDPADGHLKLTRDNGDVVDAGEVLGDGAMTTVAADPASAFSTQLDSKIADRALSARNGHRNVFLAGVIRNDGAGWALLPIGTNHRPINIDSIETDTQKITVNYAGLGAGVTVVMLATPDETLAQAGIILGTSVTETKTEIRLAQAAREVSDYVYWNGTAWVSQNGAFTGITMSSSGVLSMSHAEIPAAAIYSVSAESRSERYEVRVSATAGSETTGIGSLKLDIFETGGVADYVYWNGAAWVSDKGMVTATFNAGVMTISHPARPVGFRDQNAISVIPRTDLYKVNVTATAGSNTTELFRFDVRDSAGALVTTPTTDMKFYVQHGGVANTPPDIPTTDMKFYVRHGGGQRVVNPQTIDTTLYPFSNIWLFGVMELPA